MNNFTLGGIVFATTFFLFYSLIVSVTDMPDVFVDYNTNECIKVVNFDDRNFTCDDLPSKYNHVWVIEK